jgi:hydrogenase-4 component F
VADAAIKDHYADNLLLALGLVSLAIAAFSVAQSRNYKRMLAYSSVEHTGLICFGLGLGAAGYSPHCCTWSITPPPNR